MGILDFLRKKNEEEFDALEQAGVKVIQDDKLQGRFDEIIALFESNQLEEDPDRFFKNLAALIVPSSTAWRRAGNNPEFYKACIALEKLINYYMLRTMSFDKIYGENAKQEKIYLAYAILLPWVRAIIHASFIDKDVSPNRPIVINTQPPMGGPSFAPIRQPDVASLGTGQGQQRPVRRPSE